MRAIHTFRLKRLLQHGKYVVLVENNCAEVTLQAARTCNREVATSLAETAKKYYDERKIPVSVHILRMPGLTSEDLAKDAAMEA